MKQTISKIFIMINSAHSSDYNFAEDSVYCEMLKTRTV